MNVAISQRSLRTTFLSEESKLAELETFPKNSEVYSQPHCRRASLQGFNMKDSVNITEMQCYYIHKNSCKSRNNNL